ncbi:MAG: beta-ketoacyl-[Desulfovibrio sp.]|nr:beta-ketoacyl-[acyl-carrier-protein] synthase family protein [Desulfovibrio sp.]
VAAITMMQQNVLIGTRHLENIDPACAGPCHLTHNQPFRAEHIVKNAFAMGGMYASLVLSRSFL